MNRSVLLFLAVCCAALIAKGGLAQDSADFQSGKDSGKPYGEGTHSPVEVPPGMELVNIGGIRMIVPQGAKVEKRGSLVVMESGDEFAVRNFKEMSERLGKIEMGQEDLRKTVEGLKREISDARKK